MILGYYYGEAFIIWGGQPGLKLLKYAEIDQKSEIFDAKSGIFKAKSINFEAKSMIFEAKSGIFEAKRPKPNPRTQKSIKNPLKIHYKSSTNPIFPYIFGRIL